LTQCLVKYALRELSADKGADALLATTICEPAMGSGAFLVEAIDQLADLYLEKKQAETGRAHRRGAVWPGEAAGQDVPGGESLLRRRLEPHGHAPGGGEPVAGHDARKPGGPELRGAALHRK
jgi:hypothetical protein